MTEFILQTDPLEFQNTRQSTKITFLQQEVQQLQDHIKDLEQVVKINKEALKISTSSQTQAVTKPKNGNHNDTTASTIEQGLLSRENQRNLQLLVEQLQEESSKLVEIIDKVKQERNIAQSKALISEQICEEAQRHEIEAVAELEEKIYDLRKLLQDKEYAIQELEKLKPIPEHEGVVVKYREVLNPTEQSLKLHNELDSVNGMLAKVSKELNKLQNDKQELMTINFSLTSELAKIRAAFSSPLNFPQKYGMLNNNNEDLNYSEGDIAPYYKPAMEFNEDASVCPSPLPDKVFHDPNQGKAPVFKLDLSKAKKIQDALANKLNQAAQPNYAQVDPKASEKIKQLEGELEMSKKRLSHEMINNRLLSDEITNLQRERMQLSAANDILIKSNKRYEEKWQKVFYTLEFYKEFYHKYLDLITKGHSTHAKSSSTYMPNYDKLKIMNHKFTLDIDASPDKFIRDLRKVDEEDGKQVNVSILEAKDEEEDKQNEALKQESGNNVYEFTKEQAKFFLLNLAKDLYINTNINRSALAKNILRKLEFGKNNPTIKPSIKLKRSVSNPLDYVSERRKLIFEPRVNNKEREVTKLRKERKKTRLADDQNEELMKNGNKDFVAHFGGYVESKETDTPQQKNNNNFLNANYGHDEMISFTVDPDEFGKQKMVDVSFISNNDILDQIKNN